MTSKITNDVNEFDKNLYKVSSIDSNDDQSSNISSSELTGSISNEDLNKSHINHTILQKSSSSPIQSNLPSIFSTLRSNDNITTTELSQPVKYGKNIIKKLLHLGSDQEESRMKSIERSLHLNHSTSDLHFLENQIELQSDFAKVIGQIEIDPIFHNEGLSLTKISHKSKKKILFFIDSVKYKLKWKVAQVMPLTTSRSTSITSNEGYKSLISGSRIHEFTLDDIKSIYMQASGSSYREELNIPKEYENQWITIIYFNQKKGNLKSLHLISDSIEDFQKFTFAITQLRNLRSQLAKEFLVNLNELKENHVKSVITDRMPIDPVDTKIVRDFLSFEDILKYAKRLNINVNKSYLQNLFEQVLGMSHSSFEKKLNFEQFKKFVSILKNRADIISIWNNLKSGENGMNLQDFTHFMRNIQHEVIHEEDLSILFHKFSSNNLWSSESLNNFLLSSYSKSIKNVETKNYYDYPLTDYFISSSHNTYLIGRQVAGDSSVDGYIKALQKGCRCIEIDIWNGETNEENISEPVVNHGRTFTKAIKFANVIKTVKKFAFITTPFPLILSLETHCSPQNQLKVVSILKEILQQSMIIGPITDESKLPSPSQLKHKFIIKVKKTSSFQNLVEMNDGSFTTSTTTSMSEENESTNKNNFFKRKIHNKNTKIVNELSDLGVYVQGIKFRNFSLPESKTFNHCFSLSEKTINKIMKDEDKKASLNKHNKKYFVRVYPSKTRINSTNFNPIQYWNFGAQMVATNWQTYDLGQQINEAMFEGVDKKGYVLKSRQLRKPYLKSSKLNFLTTREKSINFDLTIISGHQLPRNNKDEDTAINPFITFEIIGGKSVKWIDQRIKSNQFKTKIIPENGFNPIWNESITGTINSTDDMIFIKFQIFNSTSKTEEVDCQPLGLIVHKLNYLKQGYRYLSINDIFGENLVYSSLLIKLSYDEDALSSL